MLVRPIEFGHGLLAEIINQGDIVIDATMGNGHDTVFLAGLTKNVFAFDVQEDAIKNTQEKLTQAGLQANLIKNGHEDIDKYISGEVKAAIFNLGYLPGSDKSVITLPQTTIIALEKISQMLVMGGRIIVIVYSGHAGGEAERNAVVKWASELEQTKWRVMQYASLNRKGSPPFLIAVERLDIRG
ncbi:MAG: class I SAM-dependent methyltransferase [Firmicutes bacterium]|nr:class I SAM-dependent methyltransferase [Bacillota bacterium]